LVIPELIKVLTVGKVGDGNLIRTAAVAAIRVMLNSEDIRLHVEKYNNNNKINLFSTARYRRISKIRYNNYNFKI